MQGQQLMNQKQSNQPINNQQINLQQNQEPKLQPQMNQVSYFDMRIYKSLKKVHHSLFNSLLFKQMHLKR